MRKLMLFSISFSLSTLCLSFTAYSTGWLAACAVFFLISVVFVFLYRRNARTGKLFCLCLGAFCGILSFSAHELLYVKPLEKWDGSTVTLTFLLTDYPETGNGYVRVTGIGTASDLPRSEILLYDNGYQYRLEQYQPGDELTFQARLKTSGIRYGKPYFASYASGLYLTGSLVSEPEQTGRTETFPEKFRILPVRTKRKIVELINSVFSPSVRPFMRSLMINDRHDLNLDTELSTAMSRAGIMHIVAVSGMHIAFLVGMIRLLFGSGKGSSLLCLLLVWIFVLVSGAPVSSVRAGIMQSFLLLAPLFRRESDTSTSLSFALLLILAVNPWAIRSVSLQLSFGAVVGILLFAQPLYRRLMSNRISRLLRPVYAYLVGVVSCSVGVMIVTVPLCALHFRSVQILSLLTNVLVLWAVSFCFCLGYLSVLLFSVLPVLGRFLALPASFFAEYILEIAERIASLPHATLYIGYTDYRNLYFLLAVFVLFLLFRFLHLPFRYRISIPFLLSFLLFCALISFTKLEYDSLPSVFNVLNVGQGQCVTVFSGTDTVMIDCGSTMTAENAGSVAGRFLRSCERDQVDLLVLTHLHADHANGVETLLDHLPVKKILIREDLREDTELLPSIRTAAEAHNTELIYISQDTEIRVGNVRLKLYRSAHTSEDDNERCLICLVSVGDYDMLVTGDIPKKTEEAFLSRADLPLIDLLVLGHHGSKTSTSDLLLQTCQGAAGVLSTGYNTYGHPAEITLENAEKALSALYRTDQHGSVQFIQQKEEQRSWLKRQPKLAITHTK